MSSGGPGAANGGGKPSGAGPTPDPTDSDETQVVRDNRGADLSGATEAISSPDPEATAVVRSPDVRSKPKAAPEPDPEATAIVRSPEPKPRSAPSPDPNRTQLIRPPDPDATQALSGTDNAPTHVIRPPAPEPPPPTWRGSADVRVSDMDADNTWTWSTQSSGRAWWLPILLGIVGLLILFGVAFWLVRALNHSGTSAPVVPPPASATTVPAKPTTVPSTVPSAPPSAPPSVPSSPLTPSAPTASAAGSLVTVPTTLVGLLTPDVQAELNSLGLKYKMQPKVDNDKSVLPNTVLSTDPAGGTAVAPGTVVTIVYAIPPTSVSPSAATGP